MRMALGGGRARDRPAVARRERACWPRAAALAGIVLGYVGSRSLASWLEAAFGVTGATGLDARVLAITAAARARHERAVRSRPGGARDPCRSACALIESGSELDCRQRAQLAPPLARRSSKSCSASCCSSAPACCSARFEHLVTLRAGFDGDERDDGDVLAAGRALSRRAIACPTVRSNARPDARDSRRRACGSRADAAVRARAEQRLPLRRRRAESRNRQHDLRDAGVLRDAAHPDPARTRVHGRGHGDAASR